MFVFGDVVASRLPAALKADQKDQWSTFKAATIEVAETECIRCPLVTQ